MIDIYAFIIKEGPVRFRHIVVECRKQGFNASFRVIDRTLQRLRRRGWIVYSKEGWKHR